ERGGHAWAVAAGAAAGHPGHLAHAGHAPALTRASGGRACARAACGHGTRGPPRGQRRATLPAPLVHPSPADVRRFFCAAHAKQQAGQPMEAIETLAGLWTAEHPEYHADLADAEAAVARAYAEGADQANPFLHLSMHLS